MKPNKITAAIFAAVLALGAMSAQAGTTNADITVTGTSVGTCTLTNSSVNVGDINFGGAVYQASVTLGISCSDAGVPWSLTTPTPTAVYKVNGTDSGSVTLTNTDGGWPAFTHPISGTGSNATVPVRLDFAAPTGATRMGAITSTITLVATY